MHNPFPALLLLVATLGVHAQSPCDNLNAGFQVTVDGHLATFHSANNTAQHYIWNFGDGTSVDGVMPVHNYAEPGTYTACLTVWAFNPQTQDTCYADHCEQVVIAGEGSPCDNLDAGFQVTVSGHDATFHSANVTSQHYTWHFGDGTSGDGPMPVHTYAQPGTYTACVLVWAYNAQTQDTCYADHCETVVIAGEGSPCDNLNAGFQVTVSGPVAIFHSANVTSQHYSWHFGDGTSGDGPMPVHTYAEPGTYTACVLVWAYNPQTQDTCYADHCETVVIAGEGSPCDNLDAGFQVTVNGPVAIFHSANVTSQHYTWQFGDGTSGDGVMPVHTYAEPGTYTACLLVWAYNPQTQDTCYADHCETVVIAGEGSPCDNLDAGFQVTVDGPVAIFHSANITSQHYTWHFGDGTSGDGPMPVHTYAQPGIYTACLIVWAFNPQTQDTCYADHCETVVIAGEGSPCDNLNAGFQVTVSGHVATFHSANITSQHYSWQFGDGTSGDGLMPVHTYAEPGTYTACVLVWAYNAQTQDTCYADHCETVVIAGEGSPCDNLNAGFQVTVSGPVAIFHSANVTSQHYTWHFGDGTSGDGPMPVHTYAQPGTYTACLIVWAYNPQTQDTCYADHCEQVVIAGEGSPCDNLNAGFQVTVSGHVATFHSANITSQHYSWSFGDGTSGDGPMPVHTYAEPGTYTACVLVWAYNPQTQDTCYADHCEQVVIAGEGSPCDNLNAGFQVTVDGHVATFHSANNTAQHYSWQFGDGTSGDGPMPVHTYAEPGTYTACVLVWAYNAQTQDTCYADHCETVVIVGEGSPCDNLNAGFQVTVDGHVATFHSANNTAQHYSWQFGDGTSGDGMMPVHTYAEPGTYTACLLVWAFNAQTQDTCYADHCETVDLLPEGINVDPALEGISAWPQPFHDQLMLKGGALTGPVRITLLDMAGQVVDDRRAVLDGTTEFNYSSFAPGSYFLRLQSGDGQRTLRVVKY